jgi:Cas10/Cmr2, second palm domain
VSLRAAGSCENGDDGTGGLGLIKIDDYFESVEWSAVIHADGNRLGELFQKAIDQLDPGQVRDLSEAVDGVAKQAFRDAVAKLAELTGKRDELPIVPLIIGGDDLTVLVSGEYCLEVVHEYLTAFSGHAKTKAPIEQALRLAGRPALTVSAGVAIVKPHFPFSVAYRLSEELCQSAKSVVAGRDGCHGLDVHVLLDSVITSLDAIRERYRSGTASPSRNGPTCCRRAGRPCRISGTGARSGAGCRPCRTAWRRARR